MSNEITTELLENASRDFDHSIQKAIKNIETSFPNLIFQEKHIKGHLWWKKVWYRYYKYSEGSMIAVSILSREFIDAAEKY